MTLQEIIASAIRRSGYSVTGKNTHPVDDLAKLIAKSLVDADVAVLMPGEIPPWLRQATDAELISAAHGGFAEGNVTRGFFRLSPSKGAQS